MTAVDAAPVARSAAAPGAGRRLALLIAMSRFEDEELATLRSSPNDVADLAEVLGDPEIGDFEVKKLVDAPLREVALALEDFFWDRSADDLLLLHITTHGFMHNGRLYLATADTRRHRLASSALSADHLRNLMDDSRAKHQILLLDSSYSGAFK